MNYGFIKPIIESDHYVFGAAQSLDRQLINPNRNWLPFVPDYEPQASLYETDGCTVWGTQNCVETLDRMLFDKGSQYSKRFNYILAKVSPDGGGDAHTVAESIRNYGLIDESSLPLPSSLDEFVQPNPMSLPFLKQGEEWLNEFSFGHEWVFVNETSKEARTALIREALQYSPLGVSVTAWKIENGVYVDNGLPNNHWVCLLKETPSGWLIFDSYDTSQKIVSFDHNISYCKRYSLSKVSVNECSSSFLARLFDMIFRK